MNSGNRTIVTALVLVAVILLVPIVTMTFFKDGLYYPHVTINTAETVDTNFLFNGRRSESACQRVVNNISHTIATVCPSCKLLEKQCLNSLEPARRRLLSAEPLDVPSSRVPDGVITYRSAQPEVALAACQESARLSPPTNKLACHPPSVARPFTAPQDQMAKASYLSAAWFGLVSGIVCWLVCLIIVRSQHLHGNWSLDGIGTGPQKFHAVATPRVGGLAVLIGLLFTGAGLVPLENRFSIEEYGYLLLAALPAFAAGFAEDITKRVGVMTRLICTMLAAALCAWLLAAVIRRTDVPYFDELLMWTPFAIAFTAFAVSGVANAINIIDGYNGLATGYSILVLTAIAWVASQVGDLFIFTTALATMGTMLGFLVWNYPRGRIFLGDGGAYFLGFWIAELSVLLVARHPSVSPWFPVLLLFYPVFETLFSIYRRRVHRGRNPGHPDALHFHQLVYTRIMRFGIGNRTASLTTARNSTVATYVWGAAALLAGTATLAWKNTPALVSIFLVFCILYVWLYARLVHWRTPRCLITRKPLLFLATNKTRN